METVTDLQKFGLMERRFKLASSLTLIVLLALCEAKAQQLPEQASALLEFRAAVQDPFGVLQNWTSTENCNSCVCRWRGITCKNGSVTSLDLGMNSFSGSIPDVVGNLIQLTKLNLGQNFFSGNIPDSLGELLFLEELDLHGNALTGIIPPSFSRLDHIKTLALNSNFLSGGIPDTLAFLTKMITLNLSNNSFNGFIPQAFSELTSLQELYLHENAFSDVIPDSLGILPKLRVLDLSSNFLSGPLPVTLTNVTTLQTLRLANNSLEGLLPPELFQLSNLQILDLSGNLFYGSIPEGLDQLSSLEQLKISRCGLSGVIPEFYSLFSLVVLNVRNNFYLAGNVSVFYELTDLQDLDASNNDISGALPNFNSSSLVRVNLANNEIVGPVPPDLLNNTDSVVWLYGNPVCNTSDESVASLCREEDSATQNTYITVPFCSNLTCVDGEAPNSLIYGESNNTCECSLPLVVVLEFMSPSFNIFTAQIRILLQRTLARELDLTPSQVWMTSANRTANAFQVVEIQFFWSGNATSYNESAANIIANLSSTPDLLGDDFGPFSVLLSFLGREIPPELAPPGSPISSPPPPPSASASSPAPSPPPGSPPPAGGSSAFPPWAVALVSVGAVAVLGGLGLGALLCRRPAQEQEVLQASSSFSLRLQDYFVKRIPLPDIVRATEGFSEQRKVGEGGYGTVYRGQGPEGQDWAVKRARVVSLDSVQEFQKEVDTISRMSHANLVRLLGWCDEGGEHILVYEYMPGGSLRKRLRPSADERSAPALTFLQRLGVAVGAAEGLRYLHTFASPAIIHRDVKSDNILLDGRLQAKVSDFGLLKNIPAPEVPSVVSATGVTSVHVAGTPGYMDPEYYTSFRVTTKSDVYSFGVVLLELITGRAPVFEESVPRRPPNSALKEMHNYTTLVSWALPFIAARDVTAIADPLMEDDYPRNALQLVSEVSATCVQRYGRHRPDMTSVARRLGEIQEALKKNQRLGIGDIAPTFDVKGWAPPEGATARGGQTPNGQRGSLEDELHSVERTLNP